MVNIAIIGPGRAGRSLGEAIKGKGLGRVTYFTKNDDISGILSGFNYAFIATKDSIIKSIADSLLPDDNCLVAHLSGALPLEVLNKHSNSAVIHPLVTLPNPEIGSKRLIDGCYFCVEGSKQAFDLVDALGGKTITLDATYKVLYHACACVSANHVVALMCQAQDIASFINVPFDAYLNLAKGALEDVKTLGARPALTGPAERGDDEIIDRHVAALKQYLPELADFYIESAQFTKKVAIGTRHGSI
jgi:predicted short-subunit dehydrogenase-like oxidoreductase (DUF2520 family)